MALVQGAGNPGVYGGIYSADGVTAQGTLGTTAALLSWNYATAYDGLSSGGVTPDKANSKITVANAGDYQIHFDISFSGTGNASFQFHLRVGGVEVAQGAVSRKLGAGGDIGNCGFTTYKTLAAGDVLTIYVETDNVANTDSGTMRDAHFNVTRVRDTG